MEGVWEDYRFTGKEEDVEVGLQYFGKRFYAPLLGRWVSADPLAIHAPGQADLNLYVYVSGQALKATDPLGLQAQPDVAAAYDAYAELANDVAERVVGAWQAVREKVTRAIVPESSRATYERARRLTPVKVPEPVKSMNDGLMAHTPEAAMNTWLVFTGAVRTGAIRSVPAPVKPPRIAPARGVVNVGGGTETPQYTNLNPIEPGTGGPVRGIQNHIQAQGERMGEIFIPGSVERMVGYRLPYMSINWEQIASGAASVMKKGGDVLMNTWVRGDEAAQAAARQRITNAFKLQVSKMLARLVKALV